MKFNLNHIVHPANNYKGLSYGDWAVIFWNWLLCDQPQGGSVHFLRGNVDVEPAVVVESNAEIKIFPDVGIFFPIICSIDTQLASGSSNIRNDKRIRSAESQSRPQLLEATVDDITIPHLEDYYAETPEFILRIAETNKMRKQIQPPIRHGKSTAISAGYWLLLRSLPLGIHRIRFKGIHKDGFETSGDYKLTVVKRPIG
jgi:hypothetical protein